MSTNLILLVLVTVAFGVFSGIVLLNVGYMGILGPAFQAWGPAQVFFDLVIVAVLGCIWMVNDARSRGRNAWPFVALTLVGGCFGILFYLIARELAGNREGASDRGKAGSAVR